VLVSEATRNVLAEAGVARVGFSDLGDHELKGLPRPEHIFQLVVADLRSEFPPLRAADTGVGEPGAFDGRERELEQAAVGRLRQTLSSLRRVGSTPPDLEELAWKVRALLPLALPGEQKPLSELSRALLTGARSAAEADRYLASLDRDSTDRQLREYRELGVTSKRAAEKTEALASRLAHIDRLGSQRKRVQKTATELTAGIRSLSERIRNRQASPPADLSAELATLRVRAESADLEGLLAAARGQLDLMDLKLSRTRYRGVFRHGERYIVPHYDEVGVQHRKEFQTRDEARSFRWSVRFAQNNKGEYTGPWHDNSGLSALGGGNDT
jgi:hypothetical protein